VKSCTYVNKEDGAKCDEDIDPCTTDTCVGGKCVHSQSGWSAYGGHCYKYFEDPKNWTSARNDCIAQGGDLASTANAAENDFIHSITPNDRFPWIGFNDIASENSWQWSDGSAVTYTYWNSGEPNNSGDEDCTHIHHYSGSADKKWNDGNCGSALPYICEKK